MEYKFVVCTEDTPGLPGLSKGDAVLPWGTEIIEGYEYEVWHRLEDKTPAKTRIEHHDHMEWTTIECQTVYDAIPLAIEAAREALGC